jgi:hypothetical protein
MDDRMVNVLRTIPAHIQPSIMITNLIQNQYSYLVMILLGRNHLLCG